MDIGTAKREACNELRSMPVVLNRMQRRYAISEKASKKIEALLRNWRRCRPVSTSRHSQCECKPFLVIPEVSSERRDYVPIGWLKPPAIPSNLVRVIENATLADFALITSRMHMAWLRNIGGRLKSDYRYSIGIVYNPFPWPSPDAKQKAKLETLAQAVLDARANHPDATLADLYDPDVMPPDLRKAHNALDLAVDRLYRAAPFASDRERVEHLFGLYETLSAPLLPKAGKQKSPPKRRGLDAAPSTPAGERRK